jgi:hypothetical protein
MAKAAKQVEVEITPRVVNGIVTDVLAAFDDLESARGAYMNKARKQREIIAAVYERGAAQGIPQKVMKLQIRIEQTQTKLNGLITDLESENLKLLQKVVKARGDKKQLALFADLPKAVKKPRKAKAAPAEQSNVEQFPTAAA